MIKLKDFKTIADEITENIVESSELKEKTLQRCQEKSHRRMRYTLIPAVCLSAAVLIMSIYRFSGSTGFNAEVKASKNPNASIMMGSAVKETPVIREGNLESSSDKNGITAQTSGNETLPAPSEGTVTTPTGPKAAKQLASLEEAKKYLDGAVLVPSYVPKGFELQGIQAISSKSDEVMTISIFYAKGDKSLVITIEKDGMFKDFSSYSDADINGTPAHLKSLKDVGQENAEIRWFVSNVLYTVEGTLSEDEALKVARSLK